MRLRDLALVAAIVVSGCASEETSTSVLMEPLAASPSPSPLRRLQNDGRSESVRTVGSLRRQALAHKTIRVVLEASCSQVSAFYSARTLDADCAVSGYPGQRFHGHVIGTRAVDIARRPEPVVGLVTLEIDNPDAKILPGRSVAAAFHETAGHSLMLFGVAEL